jgi:hypothetical protein
VPTVAQRHYASAHLCPIVALHERPQPLRSPLRQPHRDYLTRPPTRRGLARPRPSRVDQSDDSKHDQEQDADQEGDPRDIRHGAEKPMVVVRDIRDEEEHHVYDKEVEQVPAAEGHRRKLAPLPWSV